MKNIVFIDHAEDRRRQRGLTTIEIEFVMERPEYKRKSYDDRIIVIGTIRNRRIRIVYKEEENYLKIISVK